MTKSLCRMCRHNLIRLEVPEPSALEFILQVEAILSLYLRSSKVFFHVVMCLWQFMLLFHVKFSLVVYYPLMTVAWILEATLSLEVAKWCFSNPLCMLHLSSWNILHKRNFLYVLKLICYPEILLILERQNWCLYLNILL